MKRRFTDRKTYETWRWRGDTPPPPMVYAQTYKVRPGDNRLNLRNWPWLWIGLFLVGLTANAALAWYVYDPLCDPGYVMRNGLPAAAAILGLLVGGLLAVRQETPRTAYILQIATAFSVLVLATQGIDPLCLMAAEGWRLEDPQGTFAATFPWPPRQVTHGSLPGVTALQAPAQEYLARRLLFVEEYRLTRVPLAETDLEAGRRPELTQALRLTASLRANGWGTQLIQDTIIDVGFGNETRGDEVRFERDGIIGISRFIGLSEAVFAISGVAPQDRETRVLAFLDSFQLSPRPELTPTKKAMPVFDRSAAIAAWEDFFDAVNQGRWEVAWADLPPALQPFVSPTGLSHWWLSRVPESRTTRYTLDHFDGMADPGVLNVSMGAKHKVRLCFLITGPPGSPRVGPAILMDEFLGQR